MEINKHNSALNSHGYWEDLHSKCHYYNGEYVGYEILNGHWQSHYINDLEIGCERFRNFQYYFNKPGKRFGEQIEWK